MTAGEIASMFFTAIWRGMIQVDYPGVGVSIAGVGISFLLIRLSIAVFKFLTGFGASGSDYGNAARNIDKYNSLRHRNKENGTSLIRR